MFIKHIKRELKNIIHLHYKNNSIVLLTFILNNIFIDTLLYYTEETDIDENFESINQGDIYNKGNS